MYIFLKKILQSQYIFYYINNYFSYLLLYDHVYK